MIDYDLGFLEEQLDTPTKIKITVKTPPGFGAGEKEKPIQASISLEARKTLDDNIIIFDHKDIDIVLMPAKNKIVAFPKELLSEYVYLTQDRLFKFLFNKGIIDQTTIQGGEVFMSMEAKLPQNDKYNVPQLALFAIGKFIEEERPTFEYQKEIEREEERRLTEPGPEDSTEFDAARHAEEKGTMKKGLSPYGISAIYRM
jgi:hypothetical protein